MNNNPKQSFWQNKGERNSDAAFVILCICMTGLFLWFIIYG